MEERLIIIEKDTQNLKMRVNSLSTDQRSIKEQLKNTATKTECILKHEALSEVVTDLKITVSELKTLTDNVRDKISKELKPVQAKLDNTQPIIIEEIQRELEKVEEKKRSNVVYWLTAISLFTGIMSSAGYFGYKLFGYINQVEETNKYRDTVMKDVNKELLSQIKELNLSTETLKKERSDIMKSNLYKQDNNSLKRNKNRR
jgi:hypothetical protein